jgi:cell wall-associated NlpC family hydrolase
MASSIIWWGNGVPMVEYLGRPYIMGIYDCYSIAKDFYAKEYGINFKDYPRSEDFFKDGVDLYGKHIESEGFVRLPDTRLLRRGDIVLAAIRSRVPNHCVIALGDGTCLHHPSDLKSSISPIMPYVDPDRPFFHSAYRHKSFIDDTTGNAP